MRIGSYEYRIHERACVLPSIFLLIGAIAFIIFKAIEPRVPFSKKMNVLHVVLGCTWGASIVQAIKSCCDESPVYRSRISNPWE